MSDPIVPAPRLDLPAAQKLLKTIEECQDDAVILDMEEVTHLGALCLQVLIVATDKLVGAGRSISLINTSDRVLDQLRVMGVTPEAIVGGRP